jgi:K+/H+ antiporter YhaU regulatory subunit KhtT
MLFNPSFQSQIKAGDTVIAVGETANLKKLAKVLSPRKG